jgi:murein L,D-transpeptidase YcbB/YkuD
MTQETPAANPLAPMTTRWLLAFSACAGLGVGTGASLAVSRKSPPTAHAETVVAKAEARAEARAPVAPAPEVVSPTAPPTAELDAVIAALRAAHGRLHAGDPPDLGATGGAIPSALDEVFERQKAMRRFATEFYAEFGPGRFVRGGALTPLGAAVLDWVRAVEDHAIDSEPYDLPGLEDRLKGLGVPSKSATQPNDSAAVDTVRALLQGAGFDDAAARARLAALPALPTVAQVSATVASLSADRPPTAADAPHDATVFRAFLQLVLDSRFVRRAGPVSLRTAEAVFDKQKKELFEFIRQMMDASHDQGLSKLDPPHPQYARMVEVLAEYRQILKKGGCEKLPSSWRFRPGAKGKEVEKLQQRLACQGFFNAPVNGQFDDVTIAAVKDFQAHHDLPEEGNVLEDTMETLNVSIERRVKQIGLVLQRMRESDFEHMGEYFIRVNLPSFLLKVFEHGKVIKQHRVIVGTNKLDDDKVQLVQGHINRTKLFGTRLYEVIVNPTWILPKRVEEGELKSSIEKDADYLEKSNIKKVRLGSGDEVFIQGSGQGNVLGKVKFLLEATNAIYLHDTDKRHLFKKQRRDFSHGCMRVDQAIDFGKWLLTRDGFSQEEVDKAFSLRSLQQAFDLKKPVDLVTEYMTVDLTEAGRPVFYSDIYGYDSAYWNGNLPPTERLRWGHSKLRPRWVPMVDAATVDGWRAAGKSAPRNLGPDGKPKKESKGDDGPVDQGP